MRQSKSTFAHEVDSRHVLFRFAFRLIVLTIFASLSTRGFGPAFAALLAMAALFCAIALALARGLAAGVHEPPAQVELALDSA